MTNFVKEKEPIIIGQEDFEGFAKAKISRLLPIESYEVYMVWFNYTMGFMKGLFSFDTKKPIQCHTITRDCLTMLK
ncbi:TPA: hypothetical protein VBN14_001770 [Streptococcus agalactiae]|nr:hypothetical protein [Streptococcus agalactiae]